MSTNRFFLRWFWVAPCLFAIFLNSNVHAHGGDSGAKPQEKVEKKVETRRSASKSQLLADSDLSKFLQQKEVPGDVLIVRCSLGEFAVCRGFDVVLSRWSGEQILVGNSGTEGAVGFEGLKSGEKYIVRIENSKYQGASEVMAGRIARLDAERRD